VESYYNDYADKVGYMERYCTVSYDMNTYVHEYTHTCYLDYKDAMQRLDLDAGMMDSYAADYRHYKNQYTAYLNEYEMHKSRNDMGGLFRVYMKMNQLNRQFYEQSMKLYGQMQKLYGLGIYEGGSMLGQYIRYMQLYMSYQQAHYAEHYSRHHTAKTGHAYSMQMVRLSDLKPYPHKTVSINEEELHNLEENYRKHGIVVPLILTVKMGNDRNPYYHVLDGYPMAEILKKNNEDYAPALVYNSLPANVEHAYIQNPYFGHNYLI
jgi:hypothetical protein